jgi:hypothetical protein
MTEQSILESKAYHYAQRVAESAHRNEKVTYVPAENEALLAAIVRILEENFFTSIRAEAQIGSALRQFAGMDHSFTTPLQTRHTPDLSGVFDCEDTPQGWVEALQITSRRLGATTTLIVAARYAVEEFLEYYRQTTMDARVVIVGDAPSGQSQDD